MVWYVPFTGTQSDLQWQLKESVPSSRNTKLEITFCASFLYSCVGFSIRQVSQQSMIQPDLRAPPSGVSGHLYHWLLLLPVCPSSVLGMASSEPCYTSLCKDTSITSLCVSKLALNRPELSVRWSKCSLLTLGSLTQEMCDLSCWVVQRNEKCMWFMNWNPISIMQAWW